MSTDSATSLSQSLITDLRLGVHLVGAIGFVYLFYWHLTSPLAKKLTGYYSYGWFYQYLTFWTFNLQTLQLCMALFSDLFPQMSSLRWEMITGNMASIVFCAANTLTTMYYVIRTIDNRGLDDPDTRVLWVNTTLHVDLKLVLLYTFFYSIWLLFLRIKTKNYPYPFLNKFPMLVGWFLIVFIGSMLMVFYFSVGRCVQRLFRPLVGIKTELI